MDAHPTGLWPCPRCQASIPSTSQTCPNCGYELVQKHRSPALVAIGIVGLVTLLAVLFAAILFSHPLAGVVPPRAAPPAPEAPITLSGNGVMQSRTFALGGGDYRADWTATLDASGSCAHELILRDTNGDDAGEIALALVTTSTARTGTSYLHSIPAGSYYVDAGSDCGWSVVLTRQ